MRNLGTYCWTASSAGWFVLAYVTEVPAAWLCAIACGIMAVVWDMVIKSIDS